MGALAQQDVESEVLHRGVQGLLDGGRQTVDLVDEQDLPVTLLRENAGQIPLALQRGGLDHGDPSAHLLGDDVRQRGLAQAGRAVEEQVVERLVAALGGLDEDLEVVGDRLLADKVPERGWAQRDVHHVLGLLVPAHHGGVARFGRGLHQDDALSLPRDRRTSSSSASPASIFALSACTVAWTSEGR